MSSTNFVFTLNNYTPDEEKTLSESDSIRYVLYGREVAPETGTPHLQGYLVLHKKSRISALKKLLPRAHFEIMRGGFDDNTTYCSKSGDVYSRGDRPKDKRRNLTDWHEIAEHAKRGNFRQILDENPMVYIRYDRALRRIQSDFQDVPKKLDFMDNLWYYGPPGTGKTTKAYEEFPDAYIKENNKWWDGYTNQAVVIIDELELTDTYMAHFLKRWCQPQYFRGETKGGSMMLRPEKVIITSNYTPEEIWKEDPVCAEAVRRRFNFVYFGLKY